MKGNKDDRYLYKLKNELVIYEPRKFSVYVHINISNGKKYFGITSQNPKKRWKNGNGYMSQKHFYNSVKKYGWNNFYHIIIFKQLTEREACNIEKCLISMYNTTNKTLGYNKSIGGICVPKLNDKAKESLRNSIKERKHNRNRLGSHISEYNKKRIQETHNIPIYQFTKDMEFINEFPSLTICERKTGIKVQNISAVCNKRQKTSGGYIWIRKLDYIQEKHDSCWLI